jgi:signal transduction histidine kinase
MSRMSSTAPQRAEPGQRRKLPWLLFALTACLLILAVIPGLGRSMGWSSLGYIPVSLGLALVGALIASRTGNPEGWLFSTEGLILALPVFAQAYASHTHPVLPGASWLGWLFTIGIAAALPPLLLAVLFFPDGRLPSPRWRLVACATVAAGLVGMVCTALADVNFSNNFPNLNDPVTILPTSAVKGVFDSALGLQVPILFVVCAGSLVVRLIGSHGERRLQLKWFVYSTVVAAIAIGLAAWRLPDPGLAFAIFAPLIPLGAGVGIFKYRLYDIDVVINKTVVFGALAVFITAVYVGIVVGVGAVIGRGSSPNVGLSILATAVVAVAFQPARERVQRFANRFVYGDRATPYEVLSEFSSRMAGAYESDDLVPRMARILGEGTGASSAEVWLRVDDELRLAAMWPASQDLPARPLRDGSLPSFPHASRVLPVVHRGDLLGALALTKAAGDRVTPTEEKLATDLAAGAGLVLRNVRLTEELLARLEELKASRQRLVSAQDAERRRLERNIHDGAQQQLVALAIRLRMVRRLTGREPDKANEMLEQIEREITQALEDLRDLARGIYPPLLADQGLAVALRAQADRAVLRVDIKTETIPRYAQEIEACVYFCVLEALQNASKYSKAEHVSVEIIPSDGWLQFSVADDGDGFDMAGRSYGTGLRGMADRLAALGGDLNVKSAPGVGTEVCGKVPAVQKGSLSAPDPVA